MISDLITDHCSAPLCLPTCNQSTLVSFSCSIYLGATVVLSGGKGAQLKVVQYSDQAWLRDLPDLNVGRYSHACSSYSDSETGSQVTWETSHEDTKSNIRNVFLRSWW